MAYLKEAWEALENGHEVFCCGLEIELSKSKSVNKFMKVKGGCVVCVNIKLLGDNFTIKLKKPVFTDFGNCFDWINAYAMDKNGRWWGYEAAPKVTRWNNWGDINGDSILIPREYAPKFDGDWKDSLCVREV